MLRARDDEFAQLKCDGFRGGEGGEEARGQMFGEGFDEEELALRTLPADPCASRRVIGRAGKVIPEVAEVAGNGHVDFQPLRNAPLQVGNPDPGRYLQVFDFYPVCHSRLDSTVKESG